MSENLPAAGFWAKVDCRGPDECWEWMKYRNTQGYGIVRWQRKSRKAHRIAMALTDGDWNSPLDVCHTCDNPPCCNPKHLWRGTAKQNIQDSSAKGRQTYIRTSGAKLTEADVIMVRTSAETGRALSKRLGLRANTISSIRTHQTWRHIP